MAICKYVNVLRNNPGRGSDKVYCFDRFFLPRLFGDEAQREPAVRLDDCELDTVLSLSAVLKTLIG